MGFDNSISREITKRANSLKGSISEDRLYLSSLTANTLSSLAGTLLNDHTNPIKISIRADGPDGFTAYTNGEEICINFEHPFVTRYSTQSSRFDAFMGMFYHEMAHVLYCDFAASQKARRTVESGILFGSADVNSELEQECLDEIYTYLGDNRTRSMFVKLYSDLDNVIADRHDEDEMMYYHQSLSESGIMKIRESLQTECPPYEDYLKLISEGEVNKLAVVFACILQYSRFGSIFIYDEALWSEDPVLCLISECAAVIDDAVSVDDPVTKFGYINRLLIKLWPVIKEEIDKIRDAQNSNSFDNLLSSMGISDSNPDNLGGLPLDDDTAQKISNAISNALNQAKSRVPSSEPPKNGPTRVHNSEENASKRPYKPKKDEKSKDSSADILNRLTNQVAQEMAEQEVDSILSSEAVNKVNAIDQNDAHREVLLKTVRHLQTNEARCEQISQKIHPYTKRLVSEIEKTLKDLQQGSITKHRQFGRIIVPGDAFRPDGRYFANKKLPKDLPDMAISILVDNSGSMSGDRIDSAREAALIIYDFATQIGVPVSVYGHTYSHGMQFIIYSDFERAGKRDRARIADMEPISCNRDGMAIEIAANLLSQRSEEYKLLIIISDGQPNAPGYGGNAAAEDIKSIIKRYRRKNIEILAAAIGDDKPMIKEIYGDSFIDITDLSNMPKQMARMVYSRLIKHI